MKHIIHITQEKRPRLSVCAIRNAVRTALNAENVTVPCEIHVLVTDNSGIAAFNRNYRGINKPTDVLSFPLTCLSPGEFNPNSLDIDRSSGLLQLGDIILSAEQTLVQAKKIGQPLNRETAYLTVHSVLHLLGYDHVDEGIQKQKMREREKLIMRKLITTTRR